MNRKAAFTAMLEGHCVKHHTWRYNQYCYYNPEKADPFRYVSSIVEDEPICDSMSAPDMWEICNPKRTKKVYLWDLQLTDGSVFRTTEFYEHEAEAIVNAGGIGVINCRRVYESEWEVEDV